MLDAELKIRRRKPPSKRQEMYGEFSEKMIRGEKFFNDIVDRAAYVYVTGSLPTHLRETYTRVLIKITRPFRTAASLDSRSGKTLILPEVADDLQLEKHLMVREVREKIRQGYVVRCDYPPKFRRPYWKVFMHKLDRDSAICSRIVIFINGAIKEGWAPRAVQLDANFAVSFQAQTSHAHARGE